MRSPKISPFRLLGRSFAESFTSAKLTAPLALACFAIPALLIGQLHDGDLVQRHPDGVLAILIVLRFLTFQVLVGLSTATQLGEPRTDAVWSSIGVAFVCMGHIFVFCFLPNIGLRLLGGILGAKENAGVGLLVDLLRFAVALLAYARVSVSAVSMVRDRLTARFSVDRATGLTEGQIGRIALFFLPIVFFDQLVTGVLLQVDLPKLTVAAISLVSSVVFATLGATATQVLYRELRDGKEGKPTEELSSVFS